MSLLPIPRLIVVRMQDRADDDIASLRALLANAVPQASLEDHRVWANRIGTMANAIVSLAILLFALMIVAMATAIGFATRGAVAANREIIEVLHFVGASDAFIAGEFEMHFRHLAFRGALIGGLSAIAFFFVSVGAFNLVVAVDRRRGNRRPVWSLLVGADRVFGPCSGWRRGHNADRIRVPNHSP